MPDTAIPMKTPSPFILECQAELKKAIRTPQFALPTILFPVLFYTVFGVILAGDDADGARKLYLLATFGTFGAIGPALFGFGVNVAVERNNGWLDLKKISPMPISAYLFAKLFMAITFAFIVILCLSAVAVFVGGLSIALDQWAIMVITQVLCTAPFAFMGMAVGFRIAPDAAPAIVNIAFMVMSVFGGLWIPITMFPGIMQTIAWVLPTYHSGQLALASTGLVENVPVLAHAGALSVFTALMALAAKHAFQKMSE